MLAARQYPPTRTIRTSAFAGADASALPRLCQHLAVTERAAGDLLWLQGDVADKYYVLHAGLIKLFRHSTPIMTRECRDLYGDRRAVLRRRPNELARAARGAHRRQARLGGVRDRGVEGDEGFVVPKPREPRRATRERLSVVDGVDVRACELIKLSRRASATAVS